MEAGKQSIYCKLLDSRSVAGELFSLEFDWTGTVPRAGQFFMIKPRRSSVFLGRPLSIAFRKTTKNPGVISLGFLVARRGRGTEELVQMEIGEAAELTGPLGNGWAAFLPPKNKGKQKIALIGGGAGIAPLASLAKELTGYRFDFYAGFKKNYSGLRELLSAGNNTAKLVIAAEEEADDNVLKGRIPDFLDTPQYSAVFACGPEAMLRTTAERCKRADVPCFVSLERRMACGTGACLGCTVETLHGNKRCCADGPVFPAEEVFFA
jgi:NAD(P)H-flavin reductase